MIARIPRHYKAIVGLAALGNMRTRVFAVVVLAVAILMPSSPAFAGSPGWLMRCPLTHSAMDDPIKFPAQPGASHLHDFLGAKDANAFSTYGSMRAGGTTCGTVSDTGGYWTPALYRNGVKINPAASWAGRATRQQVYYRDNSVASSYRITAFPANFKMVVGNGHATTLADANMVMGSGISAKLGSEIYWGCSDNSESGKPTAPVNCATGIITLHVGFPNCWNGIQSGGDEIAAGNVKWPKSGLCPSTHPIALPRLIERFEYPVGPDSTGISLAAGNVYSAHADFWNTWDQSALQSLVDRCLNGNTDCGTNPTP
jgi:hypothetical protein